MEHIYLEPIYKERVLALWKKYAHLPVLQEFPYRQSPLLPEKVTKNTLLFIGINPSVDASRAPEAFPAIAFYPMVYGTHKDIPYFEKFKSVARYCDNAAWSHLDLFFLRETNQKVIEGLAHSAIDFLQEQLAISFEIIELMAPSVIVVANAFAAEFFGKKKKRHAHFDRIWQGYSLDFKTDFNPDIGTYTIPIAGRDTPILFSGMLSGQRALDIGSLERLQWHIQRLLAYAQGTQW